ncbi:hypothetical protein EVA_15621 [gut metagenome]|uniref:Uncharacterized protein n=1 Tax=gut metagenome TaxID=749906 RepID=J9FP86_9ZZZZ
MKRSGTLGKRLRSLKCIDPGGVAAPKNPVSLGCNLHPSLRGSNVFKQPIRYPGLRFAPPWAKTLPPLRGSWKRNIPFGMIYCRVGSNIQQLRLARSITAPTLSH